MAMIASGPSPSARATRRLSRSIPRPAGSAPLESLAEPTERVLTAPPPSTIDNVLPLSGCRLSVIEQPDGSRVGQLYGPDGTWLDETRCDATGAVSGWFGRRCDESARLSPARWWALAFGAVGCSESLEVRFASLRARRVVPVVSDHAGLWVAEAAGSFRAATILGASTTTFRLHYAS